MAIVNTATFRPFNARRVADLKRCVDEVRADIAKRKFTPPEQVNTLAEKAQCFEYLLHQHFHPTNIMRQD